MRKALLFIALIAALGIGTYAAEIHVAVNGKDSGQGTAAAPLRTIQRAADLAQPGDIITVHAGVYRERISPPRGGESDAKRITFRAAPGEKVGDQRLGGCQGLGEGRGGRLESGDPQRLLRRLQSVQ